MQPRASLLFLLFALMSLFACGGDDAEEAIETAPPSGSEAAESSRGIEYPEGLDEATLAEAINDFHAFRELKLATCPKDPAAVDEEAERDLYPVVGELRARRMIEEEDPTSPSPEVRLTLTALSQLFGFTEDEDAYYLPIAKRELVSIDSVDIDGANAVVRFKWKYAPGELGTRMIRTDAMTAEAKLVDEGDRWRVYDCKGLHPHLYNEHDRLATNRAELTYE